MDPPPLQGKKKTLNPMKKQPVASRLNIKLLVLVVNLLFSNFVTIDSIIFAMDLAS